MSLKVAICDDDKVQIDLIHSFINGTNDKKMLNLGIITACSGEELLTLLSKQKIDILFLDIEMPGMNGIEVGRTIRKTNDEIVIVYLTGYMGYALEAFEIKSFDYLVKPIYEEMFDSVLGRALRRCNEIMAYKSKYNYIIIKNKNEIVRLRNDEIYFFQKEQRQVIIYSRKGVFSYNGTLREIDNHLGNLDFLQCHQGYYINMHKIFRFKKNEIFFREINKTVPVSRKYKKSIVKVLEEQLI